MKRFRSLSTRLLGLFLLTAVLLAVVGQIGFRSGVKAHFREMTRPHIAEYVTHLLEEIGDPPDMKRAHELAEQLSMDIHVQGNDLNERKLLNESGVKFHTHLLADGRKVRVGRRRDRFVLVSEIGQQTIVFSSRNSNSDRGLLWTGLITILGVLIVLTLAYYTIRKMFQPVSTIREGVLRFTAGDLSHRIDVKRADELGELTGCVNEMAEEIQNMLESKRQLLLAISHELRSPLTRAKVNLELLENSTERSALSHDLNEMETLLEELLESERLNSRHVTINRTATDPAELIEEVVQEYFSNSEIRTALQQSGTYVFIDPVRIKLLVRNLLRNALQHTPASSPPPEISSEFRQETWQLTVQNMGPGIPPEHLSHLTEPFYRADASRRRTTGGFGLGLYLCKVIADAHEGRLRVENQEGSGIQVVVQLPLKPR